MFERRDEWLLPAQCETRLRPRTVAPTVGAVGHSLAPTTASALDAIVATSAARKHSGSSLLEESSAEGSEGRPRTRTVSPVPLPAEPEPEQQSTDAAPAEAEDLPQGWATGDCPEPLSFIESRPSRLSCA